VLAEGGLNQMAHGAATTRRAQANCQCWN
jgi:hypothetical protein